MESYNGLPASSEESHYEYIYSHQDTDVTGYVNPMALNTDNVKYATIKDDVINIVDVDNVNNTDDIDDKTNYLELMVIENKGTLDT